MANNDDIILMKIFVEELENTNTLSKQTYNDLDIIMKKIRRIRSRYFRQPEKEEEREQQTIQEYKLLETEAENDKRSDEKRDKKRKHKRKKWQRASLRLSHDVDENNCLDFLERSCQDIILK